MRLFSHALRRMAIAKKWHWFNEAASHTFDLFGIAMNEPG
jgi:hypothetical protein